MKDRTLTSSIKIRPATVADEAAIAFIADETDLFPSEMTGDMMARYLENTSLDIWFVCEDRNRILSFGFCEPERMTEGTWNLLAIGVSPDHQNTGIGSEMIAYLENQLSDRGGRVLLVETMGTPEFKRTREFYKMNSYTEEARIREFYQAGADKVIFWKHL